MYYYGVDLVKVVAGDGPPPILVWELIRGLPDDSMIHAEQQGGMQFLGWGTDRHLAASIFDSIGVNTVTSGNWKKKAPKPPEYPRPKKEAKKEKAKTTVASLFGQMAGKYKVRE